MFIFRKRGVIGLPDNFPHSKFVFYDFPIQKKIGCLRLQASDSSLSKSSMAQRSNGYRRKLTIDRSEVIIPAQNTRWIL